MPKKLYLVNLSDAERQKFEDQTYSGTAKALQFKHTTILLKAMEGGLKKALREDL